MSHHSLFCSPFFSYSRSRVLDPGPAAGNTSSKVKISFLTLSNCSNVIVDFAGAELTFARWVGFVAITDCSMVTIRNVTLDVVPLPYTSLHVRDISFPSTWFFNKSIRENADDGTSSPIRGTEPPTCVFSRVSSKPPLPTYADLCYIDNSLHYVPKVQSVSKDGTSFVGSVLPGHSSPISNPNLINTRPIGEVRMMMMMRQRMLLFFALKKRRLRR